MSLHTLIGIATLTVVIGAIVVGARTGRLKAAPCCPADPRHDLRMRDAFTDETSPPSSGRARPEPDTAAEPRPTIPSVQPTRDGS